MESIKHSPLFGNGYPHNNNYEALEAAGVFKGYYIIDNGIFAFCYEYGLIGLIWWTKLFIWELIKILKKKNSIKYLLPLLFNLFWISICVSFLHFNEYEIYGILIVINLCIKDEIDKERSEMKND